MVILSLAQILRFMTSSIFSHGTVFPLIIIVMLMLLLLLLLRKLTFKAVFYLGIV